MPTRCMSVNLIALYKTFLQSSLNNRLLTCRPSRLSLWKGIILTLSYIIHYHYYIHYSLNGTYHPSPLHSSKFHIQSIELLLLQWPIQKSKAFLQAQIFFSFGCSLGNATSLTVVGWNEKGIYPEYGILWHTYVTSSNFCHVTQSALMHKLYEARWHKTGVTPIQYDEGFAHPSLISSHWSPYC